MMWRYYELLTDVQVADIETMKREAHPMQAKKDLARRIVADFHSAETAAKAGEDWGKQFQKSEVPEELECVDVPLSAVVVEGVTQLAGGPSSQDGKRLIRLQKVISLAGLAASNTEAAAKFKQGSVEMLDPSGQPITVTQGMVALVPVNEYLVLRVGRRMKKVRIVETFSAR
jgi:tyrosyl-tRNA synthetase